LGGSSVLKVDFQSYGLQSVAGVTQLGFHCGHELADFRRDGVTVDEQAPDSILQGPWLERPSKFGRHKGLDARKKVG